MRLSNPVLRNVQGPLRQELLEEIPRVRIDSSVLSSLTWQQRVRRLFRVLTNINDQNHNLLQALIMSMQQCSAYADFFEEVEDLLETQSSERISDKMRMLEKADKM